MARLPSDSKRDDRYRYDPVEHFPAVALLGPRQCGKTTLIPIGSLPRILYGLNS